jgi:hypothetical protein
VESTDRPLLLGALPERDRVALKLGRLIMTAMIQKKEGFRYIHMILILPDSYEVTRSRDADKSGSVCGRPTSRFFLDKWLQEFRSSSETALPRSVEVGPAFLSTLGPILSVLGAGVFVSSFGVSH